MLVQVMSDYFMLGQFVCGLVTLCNVMSDYVRLGKFMPVKVKI
jgi:hypothetical protein